jgi:hypothetical protein
MKLEEIRNKTKDAVDYLVQSLESGHNEVLTQYLGAIARFHTYFFGNVMLIARLEVATIVLYLAGVNKHAGLRVGGSKQWRVSHVLRPRSSFRRWGSLLSNLP